MRFLRQLACLLMAAVIVPAGAVQAGETAEEPAELALCEAGDGAACLLAGQAVYLRPGGQADVDAAVELFRMGCALGSGEACLRLGHELEFPDTGAPDLEGAEAAYAEACALGAEMACGEEEAGTAGTEETAEMGAPEPMLVPLPPETEGNDEEDRRNAPLLVTVAAPGTDAGEEEAPPPPFASEALPDLFTEPAETDPEAEDAGEPDELAVLRAALAGECASGLMESCELYAGMVQAGEGGEADPVRARRIFSVICTQGSIIGCYELAWLFYDEGEGLAPGRARFLFSETCLAGIVEACLQAGDMRRSGEGGRQDDAGAGLFYAIACEDGLEAACGMAEALLLAEAGLAEAGLIEAELAEGEEEDPAEAADPPEEMPSGETEPG